MYSPLLLIGTYMIYHIVNVYTDCKYRITKNIWHLLFLIIGFFQYYFLAEEPRFFAFFGVIFFVLILGLLLEVFRQSSPGDTKMMIVTAVLLLPVVPPNIHYLEVGLGVVIFHLLLFVICTYIYLFWKKGIFTTLKEQLRIIKMMMMPGVPIDRTIIFTHFPGATTIMGGGLLYILFVYSI